MKPDRDEAPPPTLEYRTPHAPSTRLFVVKLLLGAGIAVGATFLAAFLGLGLAPRLFWVCAVAATAGISWAAIALYRRPAMRPLAMGLWIGFGLGLLINGLCFWTISKELE